MNQKKKTYKKTKRTQNIKKKKIKKKKKKNFIIQNNSIKLEYDCLFKKNTHNFFWKKKSIL